ncbi:MAG TPA: TonB-dependent receptor [Candidatus Kapabacteria bacterium]|nr:TonB-dependent receptor [Candidatus Kapabacteria bacterium]
MIRSLVHGPVILLLLFLLPAAGVRGQGNDSLPPDRTALTQTLRGTLRDRATQEPIAGATITVVGMKLGAFSRSDGSFRIEGVPVGRQTIRMAAIGFEPAVADIILSSGHQGVIDMELTESVVRQKEVVISGARNGFEPNNDAALTSTNTFTIDDVRRYAGSREDPARMAQNFAGVLGASSQRNDIIIRGGSPTELLWRLDGIDIPNPNHFATEGATGGPVNAINANLLANSDFITGAFPAEYGTKLSGVFDLRTRRGNTERYELLAQMGFNGFEGMVEGPLPGVAGGSFIADYRKSTLEVFNALGISFGLTAIPKYQDAVVKADIPLSASDNIAVTALGGTSDIAILASRQDSVFTGDQDINNGTDLGVAGASWQHQFSERVLGRFTLSTVNSRFRTTVDSVTTDSGNHVLGIDPWFRAHSTEGYHSAGYRLSLAPAPEHYILLGAEVRDLYYDLDEGRTTSGRADSIPYSLRQAGSGVQALGYVSWNWRPSESLTIAGGVFADYLGISRRLSVEPRLSLSFQADATQSISVGFGVHRQPQPLLAYFGSPANRDLDFTQSMHYVLGYTNHLAEDLLLKIEGYYKMITNAPVDADTASGFSLLNAGANFGSVNTHGALANAGSGRAYGTELTVMKHFSNGWYLTATGSLFRQFYTGSDGIERNGAFDNRFITNLLAGYEMVVSPTLTLEFSGKYTVAGGAPYTPVDVAASRIYGITEPDNAHPFSERNPDYSKLDLRVDFRNNLGTWSITSYVSVENVLNRKNVQDRVYNRRFDRVDVIDQLGIFPVGGVRVEF